MTQKKRAGRNRTLSLGKGEPGRYKRELVALHCPAGVKDILDRTICQDIFEAAGFLPSGFVDLLFVDPPYNLNKRFGKSSFKKTSTAEYAKWVEGWLSMLIRILKSTASIYICSDWRSSAAVRTVAEKYLIVRNRITWEREKGRGARKDWKNSSEDIWFCTVSDKYTFNVDAVKMKRRVIAPYTGGDGRPKDWQRSKAGNFRLTHPSNLWTDITVPFWSMPENTDHPTQKPEKLVAKIVLASSNRSDTVFDPFLGSGTTSVVAKKLGRHFVGVEHDERYACLAQKRLELAGKDSTIQGFDDGVFRERNTPAGQKRRSVKNDRR